MPAIPILILLDNGDQVTVIQTTTTEYIDSIDRGRIRQQFRDYTANDVKQIRSDDGWKFLVQLNDGNWCEGQRVS